MKTDSLFWGIYARCYDSLLRTIPYQRLVDCMVAAVPPGAQSLFDAGCGTGNFLQVLQRRRPELALTGLDYSPAMLSRAKAKLPCAKLTCGDLNGPIPYHECTFDVVTCVNVLFALANRHETLRELRRVLKPGGTLILSSPLARPRIHGLIAEHAKAAGWIQTIPLLFRMSFLLFLNCIIIRRGARGQCYFPEMSEVRELFENAPVSLVYGNQNWFVCDSK